MATIKIIQRTKPLSNGLFPIYLRITKDRKSKFISLNLSCEKSQWNETKEEFRKNYSNFKQLNNSLIQVKNRAEDISTQSVSNGEDITLNEFEELFLDYKKDKKISVNEFWEDKIDNLTKSGQTGNARVYTHTKRSFFNFLSKSTIYFKEITPILLEKYEVFLRSNGGTDSGVSVKMRTIRALYNDAISKEYAKKENYPFDNYKISKLKGNSNKRALSLGSIKKITKMDIVKYPNLIDTKNYFLFSYYTGGMNFYDMMNLRWENVKEDRIVYTRRKTKGNFTFKILPTVKEILDYYKSQNRNTKYVFPILLKEGLTPIQVEYRKDKTLKKYNKDLKLIAEVCEISETITSYVARHSFATNLKQKGVSTDVISEALGHQNLAITQTYLKELENDVIDDAMEKLL